MHFVRTVAQAPLPDCNLTISSDDSCGLIQNNMSNVEREQQKLMAKQTRKLIRDDKTTENQDRTQELVGDVDKRGIGQTRKLLAASKNS